MSLGIITHPSRMADSWLAKLKAEALGWYEPQASSFLTDAVASFDRANNEYLDRSTLTGWSSSEFSFVIWVNLGNSTVYNDILGRDSEVLLRLTDASNLEAFWTNGSTTFQGPLSAGSAAGGWKMIAFTYKQGVNVKLSINAGTGVQSTTNIGSGLSNAGTPFRVGWARAVASKFDGQIGPCGYWSRQLSAAEITALYNSGNPIPYDLLTSSQLTNLISFWELNESSGTRNDRHGANHLTDNNTVGVDSGPIEYEAPVNAAVTKWLDTSGNDRHWTAAANVAPTRASDYLAFDAIDHHGAGAPHMTQGDVTWLDGLTAYEINAAIQIEDTSQRPILGKWRTSGPEVRAVLIDTFGGNIRALLGTGATNTTISHAISTSAKHVAGVRASGSQGYARVGGTETGVAHTAAFQNNSEPLLLGAKSDDGVVGSYHNGRIHGLTLFPRVLTTAERAAIEAFLA